MTMLKPNHSHVLLTLGTLFAFGGASRFLPDNIATADEVSQETPAVNQEAIEPVIQIATDPSTEPALSNNSSAQNGSQCLNGGIAKSLSEDVWLFESERAAVREKELTLTTWEADLEAQTAELRALQNALNERWQQMQAGANDDLDHLAQMYGAMKADQAAQIFNQMDADFAAGFLFQLPSEQAGLILASMDQEKAYIISVSMASLNADLRERPEAKTG